MRKVKQDEVIATELEDFFIQFTQLLWAHVFQCYDDNKEASLNITEHFIIEFLGRESFASMGKLSKIAHVSPTTMTSIVDRLIRRGLVLRHRAHEDRRKVLVILSEQGKKFYNRHHHNTIELYTNFLSTLPDRGKRLSTTLKEIKNDLIYLNKFLKKDD